MDRARTFSVQLRYVRYLSDRLAQRHRRQRQWGTAGRNGVHGTHRLFTGRARHTHLGFARGTGGTYRTYGHVPDHRGAARDRDQYPGESQRFERQHHDCGPLAGNGPVGAGLSLGCHDRRVPPRLLRCRNSDRLLLPRRFLRLEATRWFLAPSCGGRHRWWRTHVADSVGRRRLGTSPRWRIDPGRDFSGVGNNSFQWLSPARRGGYGTRPPAL